MSWCKLASWRGSFGSVLLRRRIPRSEQGKEKESGICPALDGVFEMSTVLMIYGFAQMFSRSAHVTHVETSASGAEAAGRDQQ